MTKNSIIVALVICLSAINCSKTPTSSSYESISRPIVDELMNLRDSTNQKISYQLLTETEKQMVWNRHIQSVASRLNLTAQQSQVIKTVYTIIDNFFNGNVIMRSDQLMAMKKLEPAIVAAFDRGTAYRLFYSIYDPDYKFTKGTTVPESSLLAARILPADGEGGGGGSCQCDTTSVYCVCCGTGPLGTTICAGGTGCTPTSSGCGALFMYPCNANCIFV